MAHGDDKQAREDRLAERLRANLRLRKAQARAIGTGETGGQAGAQDAPAQNPGDPAQDLPKSPDHR